MCRRSLGVSTHAVHAELGLDSPTIEACSTPCYTCYGYTYYAVAFPPPSHM